MFSKKAICAGSYSFNGMRVRGVLSHQSGKKIKIPVPADLQSAGI